MAEATTVTRTAKDLRLTSALTTLSQWSSKTWRLKASEFIPRTTKAQLSSAPLSSTNDIITYFLEIECYLFKWFIAMGAKWDYKNINAVHLHWQSIGAVATRKVVLPQQKSLWDSTEALQSDLRYSDQDYILIFPKQNSDGCLKDQRDDGESSQLDVFFEVVPWNYGYHQKGTRKHAYLSRTPNCLESGFCLRWRWAIRLEIVQLGGRPGFNVLTGLEGISLLIFSAWTTLWTTHHKLAGN